LTPQWSSIEKDKSTRLADRDVKEMTMSGFIGFMNGFWGRAIRIILGLVLIAFGLLTLGGTVGVIVALIGLIPLAMGLWGHCLLELVAPSQHHTV
jgi:small-conductance mechanosensitive channel